jgi:hypothetical protein
MILRVRPAHRATISAAVLDLTTTVLTLTITGVVADRAIAESPATWFGVHPRASTTSPETSARPAQETDRRRVQQRRRTVSAECSLVVQWLFIWRRVLRKEQPVDRRSAQWTTFKLLVRQRSR